MSSRSVGPGFQPAAGFQPGAALSLLLALTLAAQPAGNTVSIARNALDLLVAEKYSDLRNLLTERAKDRYTEESLRNQLGGRLRTLGQLNNIGDPVTAKDGTDTLVSFPVQFASTKLNIQVTLNATLQVTNFSLRPSDSPLPKLWQRPPYSKPDTFTERELTVGDDDWKLGATLTFPKGKGPFPGLVLVHGPGPNDRDESIYSNRVFRDIAEGLASNGIAVLRYDKRTLIYGDKMGSVPFTLEQETAEDATRALALMRRQPEIAANRVYLLGHSLGGYAAPRIAERDSKLAGIIFFAANARPIEDVALDQNEYLAHLNGDPQPQMQQRLEALKLEVQKAKSIQPGQPVPQVVMGLPGQYLLDLKGYDPAAQAKQLKIPLLFLQGGRDFQITSKDFSIWKTAMAGRKDVTFKEYPSLNNLFIAGEGKPTPSEYLKAGNVDAAVITDITAWISHK